VTRRAFGDTAGFSSPGIWAYALTTIATILFQIPSEFAYMVGPRAPGFRKTTSSFSAFLRRAHLAGALRCSGLAIGNGFTTSRPCHDRCVRVADPRTALGAPASRAHPLRTSTCSFRFRRDLARPHRSDAVRGSRHRIHCHHGRRVKGTQPRYRPLHPIASPISF